MSSAQAISRMLREYWKSRSNMMCFIIRHYDIGIFYTRVIKYSRERAKKNHKLTTNVRYQFNTSSRKQYVDL